MNVVRPRTRRGVFFDSVCLIAVPGSGTVIWGAPTFVRGSVPATGTDHDSISWMTVGSSPLLGSSPFPVFTR